MDSLYKAVVSELTESTNRRHKPYHGRRQTPLRPPALLHLVRITMSILLGAPCALATSSLSESVETHVQR